MTAPAITNVAIVPIAPEPISKPDPTAIPEPEDDAATVCIPQAGLITIISNYSDVITMMGEEDGVILIEQDNMTLYIKQYFVHLMDEERSQQGPAIRHGKATCLDPYAKTRNTRCR